MQIDYIRRDVNEEISEDGGAFIQMVNKSTVGLKTSIDEAKAALYVVGASSMIEGYFVGIMRSVFEGIKQDGHPRTVGDITFFPVCGGKFDLEKGWDPAVNDVSIKARLINGITLDISNWTFRDVTEGRVAYVIDTLSNGTTKGVVSTDKDAELNGRNFPAKEKLSVFWTCGTKGGEVPSNKFTANVARITIDKSVFSTLTAEDDGKDITFIVKGCYNKVTKTGIVRYVAALPTFTGCDPATQTELSESGTFAILGANLPTLDAAKLAASNLKFTADTVMSQGSKYMRQLNATDEVDLAQCTANKIVVKMGGLFNDIDGGELVGGGEPVAGKLSATLEGKAVEVAYTLVRPAH